MRCETRSRWQLSIARVVYSVFRFGSAIRRPVLVGLRELRHPGAAIVVCSHASKTDHVLLASIIESARGRAAIFLSRSGLHKRRLSSALWHQPMRSLPIGGVASTLRTTRGVLPALSEGEIVCIYPSGRRDNRTQPGSFQPGSVFLAKKAQASIIVVGRVRSGQPSRLGALLGTWWLDLRQAAFVFERIGSAHVLSTNAADLTREIEASMIRLERIANEVAAGSIREPHPIAPGRRGWSALRCIARQRVPPTSRRLESRHLSK